MALMASFLLRSLQANRPGSQSQRPGYVPRHNAPNLFEDGCAGGDQRSNIHALYGDYRTSLEGVFAGGDCRRGQSLVVWAIHEGRGVADAVDTYLKEKRRDELETGKPTSVFANLSSLAN